ERGNAGIAAVPPLRHCRASRTGQDGDGIANRRARGLDRRPVAFFSLEMPAVEQAGHVVQANSRVSLNVFGQGGATQDHFQRVQRGVLSVTKLSLTLFDDRSALSDIVGGATKA